MDVNESKTTKGIIFNIQHNSIHDGPGIRTTVYLKGCPLHCFWCQNPESQVSRPEIFFDSEKCQGCGSCVPVCPVGAIEIYEGRSWMSRDLCKGSGKCAEVCPNEARNLIGKEMTAEEVFEQIAGDANLYQRSGGGVTLGGGEPLAQAHFTTSLLKQCKEAAIHTALDTCGYARWDTVIRVAEYVDLVLCDLKHMDSAKHETGTGVPNELILDNAKRIHHELSIPMLARVPIIPGYNDADENLKSTAQFIADELDSIKVHLIPYDKEGEIKYKWIEKPDQSITVQPPSDDRMDAIRETFESFGLMVYLGG